jgi:hypothetical protein
MIIISILREVEAGSGIEPLWTDLQSRQGPFPIFPETPFPELNSIA